MTTAQVVETSVTVTNSSFQNYTHPDDHTTRTTDTPGFKPFTKDILGKHKLRFFLGLTKRDLFLKLGLATNIRMFFEIFRSFWDTKKMRRYLENLGKFRNI